MPRTKRKKKKAKPMEEIETTAEVVEPIEPPRVPPFTPPGARAPLTARDIGELTAALMLQRAELADRVAAIESLLGFLATSDDLTVRLAKLELFTGINK